MRAETHDSCICNICGLNKVDLDDAPSEMLLFGAQGEFGHPNYYYNRSNWEEELEWMQARKGPRPSRVKIKSTFHALTHPLGASRIGSSTAMKRLNEQWIQRITSVNLKGFHGLDFIYGQAGLNRYWPGFRGIYDGKTPLLDYHYVKNGFGQSVQAKFDCTFIRDVVDQAMPAWRGISFGHECTGDPRRIFPTYWDYGKGEELLDLAHSDHEALYYFDIDEVRNLFKGLLNPKARQQIDQTFSTLSYNMAKKFIWTFAFYEETVSLNQAIARLQKET